MSEMQPTTPGMRRQLSQAVAWNVAFTPIKLVIDVISNIIRIGLLSKAEVGAIALLSSTASTIGIWIDLGVDQTLPKFIPEAEAAGGAGAARRFLKSVIFLKMMVLLLALAALPFVGRVLLAMMHQDVAKLEQEHGAAEIAPLQAQLEAYGWLFIAAIAALVLFGSLYDTLRTYLVSFFRQKTWNIIVALVGLALPVLSAVAVILGYGVLGVVGAMVLTGLFSVAITWQRVRQVMRQQQADGAEAPVPPGLWRRFAGYTAIAFTIAATDYFSSQYFAVYWLGGLDEIAIYWVAFSLIKQLQGYVYTPMTGIQVPLFTRVRAEGGERIGMVFGTLARLLLVLTVPAAVLSALFLRNLMIVQFPEYEAAVGVALLLIPFLFSEPFWGLGHNLLMVHERYRPVVLSRAMSLSSIPLLALLVPRMGIAGAAIALGTGKLLAGLVVLLAAMRRFDLRFPWLFALKTLLCSLLAAAAAAVPFWLWGQVPIGPTETQRAIYAGITVAIGMFSLGVLVAAMRLTRLITEEDRALLGELRNPLARRLVRIL